ncbi:MAG: DUF1269 domain-containing protein [Pseudomonadota bacterium]|nr:DUF1269 domain-containing protein [Pseudomonadota bacterium]
MSHRVYFLVPHVDTAAEVVKDLLVNHVPEKDIHLIANADTSLEDLPEAGFLQKTDFVPALKRGIGLGWTAGLLVGLAAMTFPPAGVVVAGGAVLGVGAYGATMGGLLSSMVGAGLPNSRLKQFSDAIESGEILMLVDIPRSQIDEVETLVKSHHPEAEIAGVESHLPTFP